MPPIYDPETVRPMWEELVQVGIRPLTAPEEVDEVLQRTGETTLLVINSVCGCAAGGCRPGVMLALQNGLIPDNLVTVFAGMDQEATQRAREYLEGMPPSSPNAIVFKGGKPVLFLQRRDIERMTPVDIANRLVETFNEHCSRKGPSVPREVFEDVEPVQRCSSTIPLYKGE